MAAKDAQRWDARYADATPPNPAPPSALVAPPDDALLEAVLTSVVARLPAGGTAIDLACGLGAQTVWAAQGGLSVLSLDVSPKAIEATHALARQHSVEDRVDARVHDFDGGLPADAPDAVDLVICQRFRDPDLYDTLFGRLRPGGGVGVVTVLSEVGASDPGEFHAPAGELLAAAQQFGGLDIVRSTEVGGEASIVVRRR